MVLGRLKHLVQTDVKGALKTRAATGAIAVIAGGRVGLQLGEDWNRLQNSLWELCRRGFGCLQRSQADSKPAALCCCEQRTLSWN